MTQALYLYTTSGCHLCEQAHALLEPVLLHANRLRLDSGKKPLAVQCVEIAEDPALVERYGLLIPVLLMEDDSRELRWPFSQADVFAFIALAAH